MDFEKEYFNLITKAKQETRNKKNGYYEKHHIRPKSLGGNDTKENLVLLTPEEHFLAHYLLWKFTNTIQMTLAMWRMAMKNKNLSPKEYGILRRECAKIFSRLNSKKVYCLELDKEFSSCREAALYLGKDIEQSVQIGTVCNKKIKACFEWKNGLRYHWCWLEDKEEFLKIKEKLLLEEKLKQELKNKKISLSKKGKRIQSKCIKIYCIELDKIFDSLADACDFLNLKHNVAGYLKIVASKNKKYKGYTWKLI